MTKTAAAIAVITFMAVLGTAIVSSAATRLRQPRSKVLTYFLRALPYFISTAPALHSWYIRLDLADAIAWAVTYLVLTWALVWSTKRQWGV